ncbi:hypothetical protein DSO57_1035047 [Entomophthora muscae]|uniref:Uncharacterized protein n=1 Tax=Entomophthora muscae TaxID=34485 RepID=A0ACC2TYN9_9FUNG|nr:hypothetical protein DSO57_1035047 [Entomophthora muscae]
MESMSISLNEVVEGTCVSLEEALDLVLKVGESEDGELEVFLKPSQPLKPRDFDLEDSETSKDPLLASSLGGD